MFNVVAKQYWEGESGSQAYRNDVEFSVADVARLREVAFRNTVKYPMYYDIGYNYYLPSISLIPAILMRNLFDKKKNTHPR